MSTPKVKPRVPQAPGKRFPFPTVTKDRIIERVTGLIYGPSGSGKTFLIRSLLDSPEMYPALVLSCDAGELTLKDILHEENMVVVPTAGLKELSQVANYLVAGNHPFKSLVVDNLTVLHRTSMEARADMNPNRAVGEYTQQDYGVVRAQILAVVSTFTLQLPSMNVFCTCLSHTVEDALTGNITHVPDLAGKLSGETPGYFDLVGYLSMDVPTQREINQAKQAGQPEPISRRTLLTTSTKQVPICRNRGGKLPPKMYDPTLPQLRSLLLTSV